MLKQTQSIFQFLWKRKSSYMAKIPIRNFQYSFLFLWPRPQAIRPAKTWLQSINEPSQIIPHVSGLNLWIKEKIAYKSKGQRPHAKNGQDSNIAFH